jgi:Protein of unknown function, DUF547
MQLRDEPSAPAAPGAPALLTSAARPRRAYPIALLASSALLLALVGAAVAGRAPVCAAALLAAAITPWAPRARLREIGVIVAYASIGGCLFWGLRVPLSSRVTALYLPAIIALILRIIALQSEGARRFTVAPPLFTAGPVDIAGDGALAEALSRALTAKPGGRGAVERAIVALAAAGRGAIPGGEAERRAFWINVYNVVAQHAGTGRASHRILDVLEDFRARYLIAGVWLTLDEIEHGLLRGGLRSPTLPLLSMGAGDPRLALGVPLDPRIHFALNCGAWSCPSVRVHRGASLDEELDLAEASFLGATSRLDPTAGVLEVSRILKWYARDLGGEREVRAKVAKALGAPLHEVARARLVYAPYDWTNSIP